MPVSDPPYLNIVRPLGGKSKDGKKLLEEDTYLWDGTKYIYNWDPIKKILNNVNEKAEVYQILIDNPPWAFQRGLPIEAKDQVEVYGNPWPPNDAKAWHDYIQALMKELVATYGKAAAVKWRYCIGREMGTEGHWRGTNEEFYHHYRNTVDAITSVLPEAKIGTHFLWASSKKSFVLDFIKWTHRNNVQYDFIGVSYYPFYDRVKRVDLDIVYKEDIEPILSSRQWNKEATLEFHEFALIAKMSKRGNSFDNAPKAHQESFTVMLAKMMYEHGLRDVYRWGSGEGKIAESLLLKMKGQYYYQSLQLGEPSNEGNQIAGIFSHDAERGVLTLLCACYNADPKASDAEALSVVLGLPIPQRTELKYRVGSFDGSTFKWSDWRKTSTTRHHSLNRSNANLDVNLSPFTFKKIEFTLAE